MKSPRVNSTFSAIAVMFLCGALGSLLSDINRTGHDPFIGALIGGLLGLSVVVIADKTSRKANMSQTTRLMALMLLGALLGFVFLADLLGLLLYDPEHPA